MLIHETQSATQQQPTSLKIIIKKRLVGSQIYTEMPLFKSCNGVAGDILIPKYACENISAISVGSFQCEMVILRENSSSSVHSM